MTHCVLRSFRHTTSRSAVACLFVTAALADSLGSRVAAAMSGAVQSQDAVSVWDGVYTEEQARRGERVYAQECASCHQGDLLGEGPAPALVGQTFFFRWSDLSLDDMLAATRTTMPQGAPGSLSQEAYLDVIGYLLKSNGVPDGRSELPKARDELRRIFVRDPPAKKQP